MARYVKQEMNDLDGTGEKRVYYRMKIEQNIDMEHFVEQITYPGSGLHLRELLSVDLVFGNFPYLIN